MCAVVLQECVGLDLAFVGTVCPLIVCLVHHECSILLLYELHNVIQPLAVEWSKEALGVDKR